MLVTLKWGFQTICAIIREKESFVLSGHNHNKPDLDLGVQKVHVVT